MRSLQSSLPLWVLIGLGAACDNTSSPPATSDVSATDAVVADVGTPDVGTPDVGTPDVGTPDVGTPDVGTPDVGTPDAGTPDAGTPDAGTPDAGTPDAGTPDAGTSVPDAAGLCAMLPANTAPVISDTYSTTAMPAMSSLTGGAILPGTYYQTAHIYHGVASGPVHTWQTTFVFDASGTTAVQNGNRDGAPFQQLPSDCPSAARPSRSASRARAPSPGRRSPSASTTPQTSFTSSRTRTTPRPSSGASRTTGLCSTQLAGRAATTRATTSSQAARSPEHPADIVPSGAGVAPKCPSGHVTLIPSDSRLEVQPARVAAALNAACPPSEGTPVWIIRKLPPQGAIANADSPIPIMVSTRRMIAPSRK